jgi:arginyl-tRNA synthetase
MTTQTLHAAFAGHVAAALDALEAAGTLPAGLNRAAVTVEPPRDVTHGDLATNAAMVLAKPAGTNRARWRRLWWRSWRSSIWWRAPRSPGRASSTCA